MKLFTKALLFLTLSLVHFSAHSNPSITYVTGTYTTEKMLNFIRPFLDKALLRQGMDPKLIGIKYLSHYDAYDMLGEGHLSIHAYPKEDFSTAIGYQIPIKIFYNKETFKNNNLNLTAEDIRQIIQSALTNKPFRSLGRPLSVSFGAISGITRRGIALYTGLPYDRAKQVGESPYIATLGNQFVDKSIKDLGYDIVVVPDPLDRIYFKVKEDSHIGVATVEGKKPEDLNYPLHDNLLYVSYNGKNLEEQKAIAESLKDPEVKEELRKIGVKFIEKDLDGTVKRLQQDRPDLYKERLKRT